MLDDLFSMSSDVYIPFKLNSFGTNFSLIYGFLPET